MFPTSPPTPPSVEAVEEDSSEGQTFEGWAFEAWLELGFAPEEALALLVEGLSPSLVREFVRHHPGCTARDAVAILL